MNDHVCHSAFNRVYLHLYRRLAAYSGPHNSRCCIRTGDHADQASLLRRAPTFEVNTSSFQVLNALSVEVVENDTNSNKPDTLYPQLPDAENL